MGQHTVSTHDMMRIGRAVVGFENSPMSGNLPALERRVRIDVAEGSGGGDSGVVGSGDCGCGESLEVSSVDLDGVNYANAYSITKPHASISSAVVEHDEDGYWFGEAQLIACDPPEEEEE